MIACAIVLSLTMRRLMKTFCGPRVGPCSASAAMKPVSLMPPASLRELEQIAAFAVQLVQPVALRHRRRALEHRASGAGQREADLGIRQRQLRDDARHLRRLGAVGLQELAARRQVVEEVVDLDDRAFGGADLRPPRPRRR